MLNFKLGNVISYVPKSGIDMEKAAREFFGKDELNIDEVNREQALFLFYEWLIFDYKLPLGKTIVIDYYFKNPNHLPQNLIDELKQIIETQKYEFFEVEKVKSGVWVEVYGLFNGKKYKVLEKTMSLEIGNQKICFYNRITKVNGDYYFIGSNPLVIPTSHTDRAKKLYLKMEKTPTSPKDTLGFLLKNTKNEQQNEDLRYLKMKNGIEIKRKEIEKEFEKLKEKYHCQTLFKKLTQFVYREAYKDHFADFYKDMTKIGIPEKMIFDSCKFFQDLWNFFPHQSLSGKCPAEKYQEFYGTG